MVEFKRLKNDAWTQRQFQTIASWFYEEKPRGELQTIPQEKTPKRQLRT